MKLPASGCCWPTSLSSSGGSSRQGFQATYLNLPWQCWHWSPTHPRSQTQEPLMHFPELQLLSQDLAGDACVKSTKENKTYTTRYLLIPLRSSLKYSLGPNRKVFLFPPGSMILLLYSPPGRPSGAFSGRKPRLLRTLQLWHSHPAYLFGAVGIQEDWVRKDLK